MAHCFIVQFHPLSNPVISQLLVVDIKKIFSTIWRFFFFFFWRLSSKNFSPRMVLSAPSLKWEALLVQWRAFLSLWAAVHLHSFPAPLSAYICLSLEIQASPALLQLAVLTVSCSLPGCRDEQSMLGGDKMSRGQGKNIPYMGRKEQRHPSHFITSPTTISICKSVIKKAQISNVFSKK